MKKVSITLFNKKCLALIDEVQAKRATVIITKRGKQVAKLVPVGTEKNNIFDFMVGKGKIVGDVVKPAFSLKEWGSLK